MCKKNYYHNSRRTNGVADMKNIESRYLTICCGDDPDPDEPVEDDF